MRRHTHQGAGGSLAPVAARAGFGCTAQIVGGVIILGLAWLLLTTLVSAVDPLERDRRASELYDRQALQEETYGARLFAARIWAAAPAVAGGVLLTGGSVLVLLMAYRRWATWEMLRAEKLIAQTRAATQLFPPGLESLSYHDSHRVEAAPLPPLLEAAPVEAEAGEPPTFAALLDAGRIGRGSALYLGHDTAMGEGIWGSWKDLYSAGIGGGQGSGKTWTAAGLIAQALLNGARVTICDPHAGDNESLSTRLGPLLPFCELVATDNAAILEAAKLAADELGRRRDKVSGDRTPRLLVIDEWTSLLRRSDQLAKTLPVILPDLTQEGRKYGCNALLLAQRWESDAAGGSDVRNTLTSHFVHRCRGDEARMQTGMKVSSWPGDPIALATGQAFLFTTRGTVRKVSMPFMTPADLARVAVMLGGQAGPALPDDRAATHTIGFRPAPSRPCAGPVAAPSSDDRASASGSDETALDFTTAERARILARFGAGASVHEVTAELAETTNTNERKYKTMRRRVEALLRALAVKSMEG